MIIKDMYSLFNHMYMYLSGAIYDIECILNMIQKIIG